MTTYGLIGFPLTHSFSKKYFTEKFESLGISDQYQYELFEIEEISKLPSLLKENPNLKGFNVTIPYKQQVFDYIDEMHSSAQAVGAVNVVKIKENGELVGYNSDMYGFQRSLLEFFGDRDHQAIKALVLGYGGAAKAVVAALDELNIPLKIVSRQSSEMAISYQESEEFIADHKLIINCSPLGTYPKTDTFPDLAYQHIGEGHFLFDLVYNPAKTVFLEKGEQNGALIKNGYDMLVYQAERSWEIWQNDIQ